MQTTSSSVGWPSMTSSMTARGTSSSAANALACTSYGVVVTPLSVAQLSTSRAPSCRHQAWASSWASVNRWRTAGWPPLTHRIAQSPRRQQAPATSPGSAAETITGRPARSSTTVSRQGNGDAGSSPSSTRASRARLAPRLESTPAMPA
jgi:hypothetical protein